MQGTWEGSRHIAEEKEQVLELKQSLTHQLDCLGTIPIQHCLRGFCPPPYTAWGGPLQSISGAIRPQKRASTNWCNFILPSKMNQPQNKTRILSLNEFSILIPPPRE